MRASGNRTFSAITASQARAARGLLGWSRDRLGQASGVPKRTLAGFEGGETKPRTGTVAAIRAALEAAGVEFIDENGGGPGVRLAKPTAER
jgi:transcriptional regulator with XRE-family HTH domain